MPTLAENPAEDTVRIVNPAHDTMPPTPDKPIFLDPTQRRRRVVRLVALAACTAVAGYGALLAAALLGVPVSPHALLPLSGDTPPAATAPPSTADSAQPPAPTKTGAVAANPTAAPPARPGATAAAPRPVIAPAPPVAATPAPTSAPPVAPPPTTARNSHAPTSPPGWTKHGVPTP